MLAMNLQEHLPQYKIEVIQGLVNISRGPEGGRMETLGLVKSVTNDKVFTVDGRAIKLSSELFALDLEAEACSPPIISIPEHLEFEAEWDKTRIASGESNNILGDNGGLYFKESKISIPKIKATKETLAYYGAILIPEDTAIRFPAHESFPLWKMQVGPDYVKDYIMSEEGGGFYLEYHHDQPHFHMVIEGGGAYLLAKQVSEGTFHITAFELSNGQAVYTKKGAIHCDAALIGELIVGYTVSEDCSTVLLRTKGDKKMVNVEFV